MTVRDRVNPRRQPIEDHIAGVAGDPLGLFEGRQCVIIHDAVETLRLILQCDIVLDRTQIVADMLAAGRARAAEHPNRRSPRPRPLTDGSSFALHSALLVVRSP